MKNIVVLFPTELEAKYFTVPNSSVTVAYTGVGLVASAYSTLKVIKEQSPDVLIMAGIAGAYPSSQVVVGDCVLVSEEREADLGFFYPDGFRHIDYNPRTATFKMLKELKCPYIDDAYPFTRVVSNTCNCSMPPLVESSGVDVENMEGSAFFSVCILEGIKFYELRAISNTVSVRREDWD